jgi:hypothetical protein
MFIEFFSRAWEKERQKVESRLRVLLENEIENLRFAIKTTEDSEYSLELKKVLVSLVLRKTLVAYESEEIVKRRMDLRISFFAIVLSSIALIVSTVSLFKVIGK